MRDIEMDYYIITIVINKYNALFKWEKLIAQQIYNKLKFHRCVLRCQELNIFSIFAPLSYHAI